jgi:archaellum component FlaF (FlaF/FlaG flagellin family)
MKQRYLKHIPFISFLVLLAILYIGNTHSAERKMFKIQQLQKELSETEYKCNEVKSKTSYESIQSQLEKKVEGMDVGKNENTPIVLNEK